MKRTPLKRNKPINKVSAKRRKLDKARRDTRQAVLDRDLNRCQAKIEGCTLHATDVHEIKTRARGGNIVAIDGDLSNFLSLCRWCHRIITDNPAFSERNGFIIPAWGSIPELRAAKRARQRFYDRGFEDEEE